LPNYIELAEGWQTIYNSIIL